MDKKTSNSANKELVLDVLAGLLLRGFLPEHIAGNYNDRNWKQIEKQDQENCNVEVVCQGETFCKKPADKGYSAGCDEQAKADRLRLNLVFDWRGLCMAGKCFYEQSAQSRKKAKQANPAIIGNE